MIKEFWGEGKEGMLRFWRDFAEKDERWMKVSWAFFLGMIFSHFLERRILKIEKWWMIWAGYPWVLHFGEIEREWVGCLEITRAKGKERAGGEAAKQASLEELGYGHYGYLYFGFLCFPTLSLLILSIVCWWLGYGYHVMYLFFYYWSSNCLVWVIMCSCFIFNWFCWD